MAAVEKGPSGAYRTLEFGAVVALVARHAASPLGVARAERLLAEPKVGSLQEARASLRLVGEASEWLRASSVRDQKRVARVPSFAGVTDVRGPVDRLTVEGLSLEAGEIRAVVELLEAGERIRKVLLASGAPRPGLRSAGEAMPDLRRVVSRLAGRILPNDEISSLASTALSKLRRRIEHQRRVVETSLERFLRKHSATGILQDSYVTMRNGRTVAPVKAQWKGQVDGIVHGASSSGQTVFVEPLDTIVQNNRLVRLREQEHAEILRILREMSAVLRDERPAVVAVVEAVGDLDFVFARARFSREFRCCLPSFDESASRMVLTEARHPLLQELLSASGGRPVPLSLSMEREHRALVVSGPNAGGKTVVLKTAGLLAAMAQAAIPVPADEAELPWFDAILADVGDAQSISRSLSTFSAHIAQLTRIMGEATPRSLVILDELGTATDPEDGGALAVAVVERLLEVGGFSLVSTHLQELKTFGTISPRVLSATMGFDEATLRVTYRLHCGFPGQSAGLEMARSFGLPPSVVRRARLLKGQADEQVREYLAELRRRAAEYDDLIEVARREERNRQEGARSLEEEFTRRQRDLEDRMRTRAEELESRLEKRFRKALSTAVAELRAKGRSVSARAVSKWSADRTSKLRRVARAEVEATLGRDVTAALPDPDGPSFEVGERVRHASMGITGEIVRELGPGRWEVQFGRMRVQASAEDLLPTDKPAEPPPLPPGVSLKTAVPREDLPAEIHVIGKSAEDALSEVDKYLDRAVLADRTRVRVVHGFGKDILRRAIWQMLARHAHVTRYYQAEQHEGGAGATIIEVGEA